MADKLKPCPFCGEVHTVERMQDLHWGALDAISCNSRTLMTAYHGESVEKMVDRWNSRPVEDALRAELAKFANPSNWHFAKGETIWLYKDEPWGMAQAALDAAGGDK